MKLDRTYKILYVEDSLQLAELCAASLGIHGYEVDIAANCAEGTKHFSTKIYDLILLDYNLPDGDGLELAKKFLTSAPDIPIVFITAQGSETIAAQALGLGVSDYIIKSGKDVYTEILPRIVAKTIANAEAKLETKRLQQEVKSNEANLQAFLDALKDRAVLIENDGTILAANDALSSIFGVSLDQVVGKNIYDYDNPKSAERRKQKAQEIIETGKPIINLDFLSSLSDSYVEVSGYPVIGEDGKPARVAFLSKDVTERVEMQNSIREKEQRATDFAELGADRFFETDENFNFVYFSPPVKNLNMKSDVFIGKKLWDFVDPNKMPNGLRSLKEHFEKHQEVHDITYNAIQARSKHAHLRISAKPMFDDEEIFVGYRGIVKDETGEIELKDRAESVERQFFETLENSEMGLALWGPDERLVTYNSRYIEFNSIMSELIEIGVSYEEFSKGRLTVRPAIKSTMSHEDWLADRLEKFRSRSSSREFGRGDQSFEMKTQRFADGSTMMYLSDVTLKNQYEANLRQTQKMEAVGQMTGGIAHDFNNILAALHGNLSLMEDDPTDIDKLKVRLDRAKKTAMRGADLTKRLLAFSRKQNLEPVSTDVHGLVSEIMSMMQRTLGESVTIDLQTISDLKPAMVDTNQLENAILNLVINARDAMPGGGAVQISTFNHVQTDDLIGLYDDLEPGNYVAISVKDTGHGISDNILDKVFEPFFTTKEFGQGSGLGLSMVHGFIKQTGGGVKIESEVGEGTVVSLLLPMSKQEHSTVSKVESEQVKQSGKGETVMVIEDDVEVREIMVSALENSGYAVIDGGNGAKAIDIANSTRSNIDLLLTDVMLPNGNRGPILARQIGSEIKDLKVLLMTGYAQENLLSSDEYGHGYPLIQKPFEIRELISTIQGIIHP